MKVAFVMLLSVAGLAEAAALNKCVDASGHVTFTQQSCPGGASGESITVRSSSAGMSLGPSAQPVPDPVPARPSPGSNEVGVIGGAASVCDGGSDQDIRTAIVRNEIYVGMTAKQVTQSWGAPSKINRSSRGSDQWVYYRGNSVMDFVYVDQAGCVTAWN